MIANLTEGEISFVPFNKLFLVRYTNTHGQYARTHRHLDTQIHGHTDTRTHRHTDTQTHGHTDIHIHRLTHSQTHRHTNTLGQYARTHRHSDTQKHGHTDRRTDRHTDTYTVLLNHIILIVEVPINRFILIN